MSAISGGRHWVVETGSASGSLIIGVSFIFVVYFLHPAVESAYHRVRAYRAWRSIEKRQAVEVTRYPLLTEVFGGRGRWDAARITTALMVVFALAACGLELSMSLATFEGVADILNRPPPVELVKNVDGVVVWKVKSREDLAYDGEWRKLPGMFDEKAKSRYTLKEGNRHINGDNAVAFWQTKPNEEFFYYTENNTTTVAAINCTAGGDTDVRDVYHGDVKWGSIFSCEQGPPLTSTLETQLDTKRSAPPTLVMNRLIDDKVFFVVEEISSYPTFMYSVWSVVPKSIDSNEVQPKFHIAATMRLAEAVVTGVVHGETTGGGCFGLLRQYSDRFSSYDKEAVRAFPFGESPGGDSNANIQDLETLEYGLKIDTAALLCFACVMLMTSIGVAWSCCLRSSIGMDVYNRDELIRAVSLHRVEPGGASPSDIRIFVRREDAGYMSVVISDTRKANNICARFLQRRGQVVEHVESSLVAATVDQYNRGFGGADVPVGPRTVWLEGVRSGLSRSLPGRNGNFEYPTSVALSASPVPSNSASLLPRLTPLPSRRSVLSHGLAGLPAENGAAAIFDSINFTGDSPGGAPKRMRTVSYDSATGVSEAAGLPNQVVDGQRTASAVSQATSVSDIDSPRLQGRSVEDVATNTPLVIPEREPPDRRGLIRSSWERRLLTQDVEEGTE